MAEPSQDWGLIQLGNQKNMRNNGLEGKQTS